LISHVTALSSNHVIGDKGRLPWHIPEDLKFFKSITLNKCIIMGRKTYESLGKPLPNRHNVIITRNPNYEAPGCSVFSDIQEAIAYCRSLSAQYGDEIMIVGGAEIYKQTLAIADRLYLTLIEKEVSGDAHYPDWHQDFQLSEKRESQHGDLKYAFCIFERKK
jgi:dihydrofolate reductase